MQRTNKTVKTTTNKSAERAKLIASRSDFGPELRAALSTAPIAKVRELVKTLPRKPTSTSQAVRMQGDRQAVDAAFADFDRVWGIGPAKPAVMRTPIQVSCSALGTSPQPMASALPAGAPPRVSSPSAARPTAGAAPTRDAQVDELCAIEARLGLPSRVSGVQRSASSLTISNL